MVADAVARGEEVAVADQAAAADEAAVLQQLALRRVLALGGLVAADDPRLLLRPRLGCRYAQQQPQERAEARESDRASAHRVLL
jgi:hypothetical protein